MVELAVCVSNQNELVSPIETIDAVCNAGFKNVFIQWYDRTDLDMDQTMQVKELQKRGINIIFAHLGYDDMDDFYDSPKQAHERINRYIKDLDDLKSLNISLVCMHVLGKRKTVYTEAGLKEFRRLAEHAKEIGVTLTFENTISSSALMKVFDYTKDLDTGICVDVGHINCKFNGIFDYQHYKDYIKCVHIHDNLGPTKDLHLLPFDGEINYLETFKELKAAGYDSYLTMELIYQNKYLDMDVNSFYKEGYKRGQKLQELFESID